MTYIFLNPCYTETRKVHVCIYELCKSRSHCSLRSSLKLLEQSDQDLQFANQVNCQKLLDQKIIDWSAYWNWFVHLRSLACEVLIVHSYSGLGTPSGRRPSTDRKTSDSHQEYSTCSIRPGSWTSKNWIWHSLR